MKTKRIKSFLPVFIALILFIEVAAIALNLSGCGRVWLDTDSAGVVLQGRHVFGCQIFWTQERRVNDTNFVVEFCAPKIICHHYKAKQKP